MNGEHRLRWLNRDGKRVLQEFVEQETGDPSGATSGEWKDVPTQESDNG